MTFQQNKERALKTGDEILAAIEEVKEELEANNRMSDSALDFFDGVKERTESMIEYANDNDGVTEKQMDALNNMFDAVNKWKRDE